MAPGFLVKPEPHRRKMQPEPDREALWFFEWAEPLGLLRICGLALGTGLVAGGASAFNQVYERDIDALMQRTRWRPLPRGELTARQTIVFAGVTVTIASASLIGGTIY